MNLAEGIAFGSLALGFLGFVYKTTQDEVSKRSRIYTRLDEIKKQTDEKFQTKEICNIHIDTVTQTLNEIKNDVKTLLRKNGFKDGN